MLCLRLLFIMMRWELMRTLYERGVMQRLVLPQMIFLIWLVVSGAFLPWMLQLHQIMLGLSLAQSSMLVLIRIADSFAGERERSTLEVLLLSPVPDWILVAGKALALLVVALLSFGAAMLFYGIVAVLFTPSAPAVAWFATAFLLGLMVLLTLINVGLMVSWRAPSVQTAQQMLLYPPVAMMIIAGLLAPRMIASLTSSVLSALEPRDLLIISAVCAIGSSLVVWRAFRRGRLLLR